MNQTKKELSYFRLKLETYLSEHFPEMLADKSFITARADEALTVMNGLSLSISGKCSLR